MAKWLASLASMPYVLTAVLVADNGLEIEAIGGAVISSQRLAAETASLVRASTTASTSMGGGKLFRWSFTTDNFEVISLRVGDTYSLTVAIQRGSDPRQLQVEMARLSLQLVQQLEG
jgi:predicted regulator of Ras-like GTPase activity (Roadblock/LC7/MglB family)